MNTLLRITAAAAIFAAIAAVPAKSWAANNASFSIAVTVVPTIALQNTQGLDFGNNAPGDNGGTVTVRADGTRINAGTMAAGGKPQAAGFTVTGAANNSYTITLPSSTSLNGSNGGEARVAFRAEHLTGGSLTRTMDKEGKDSFNLGGALTLDKSAKAGSYTGTATVTVSY